MKASELMTRNPKTCEPSHDLACAIGIMRDEDTGIVPVTEGNGAARRRGSVARRVAGESTLMGSGEPDGAGAKWARS